MLSDLWPASKMDFQWICSFEGPKYRRKAPKLSLPVRRAYVLTEKCLGGRQHYIAQGNAFVILPRPIISDAVFSEIPEIVETHV